MPSQESVLAGASVENSVTGLEVIWAEKGAVGPRWAIALAKTVAPGVCRVNWVPGALRGRECRFSGKVLLLLGLSAGFEPI